MLLLPYCIVLVFCYPMMYSFVGREHQGGAGSEAVQSCCDMMEIFQMFQLEGKSSPTGINSWVRKLVVQKSR